MSHPLSPDFRCSFEELTPVARGVSRPECVLLLADGTLLTSLGGQGGSGGAGYSIYRPDGTLRHVLAQEALAGSAFIPNGITLSASGEVVFAHLGVETGGVFAITDRGLIRPVVTELEGRALPPTNFVTQASDGRLWFTVSTHKIPRSLAWNKTVSDGYIAVHDSTGTRIVADGLGYTNEIGFSPDGQWLYANETYAQRVSRFPLRLDGSLGQKEVVAQLNGADLPDGLTFDAFGGIWVTCIASNRVLLLRPDGDVQVVLEDSDPELSAKIERGIRAGTLVWEDMQSPPGQARLGHPSSLAFGLPGSNQAYIGNLACDCLWRMNVPVYGAVTPHFHRRLAV